MHSNSKRKIALLGFSGSGKSTVSEMIKDRLGAAVHTIAFAGPLKDFAGDVFGFTHDQLWGPSESRNAPDPRFSGDARASTIFQIRKRYEAYKQMWIVRVVPKGTDTFSALRKLERWFDETLARDPLTPRYVLQTLGTEWGRKIHDRIWSLAGVTEAERAMRGYRGDPLWVTTPAEVVIVSDLRFLNEAEDWTAAGGEIWMIDRPSLDESQTATAGIAGHASEAEQKSPEMRKYITHTILNDGTLEGLKTKVLVLLEGGGDDDGGHPPR